MIVANLKNKILAVIEETMIDNDRQLLIEKLEEEIFELCSAIRVKDHQNTKEEIADVLIVLVQVMHLVGFTEKDLDEKLTDVFERYGGEWNAN